MNILVNPTVPQYVFTEKNPHISGTVQFMLKLFKGQPAWENKMPLIKKWQSQITTISQCPLSVAIPIPLQVHFQQSKDQHHLQTTVWAAKNLNSLRNPTHSPLPKEISEPLQLHVEGEMSARFVVKINDYSIFSA